MSAGRWTKERAAAWRARRTWSLGFNYVPSTAVNATEMWQAETFDESTIVRETGWARDLGYDACRIFLPYRVWKTDADGFLRRFGRFLDIAAGCGIRILPVLFDDCNFDRSEPTAGPQPDPVPGVHNSRWTPSPGETLAHAPEERPRLEAYVRGVVGLFARDDRVLAWDLYNEPGNSGCGARSLPLLESAFRWARDVGPDQPLTAGAWGSAECDGTCRKLSDVISFHRYGDREDTEAVVRELAREGRPLLCTEWMHRPAGSRFETHLPLFAREKVDAFQWGLVVGRTQTNLSWDTMGGKPEPHPALWQHDLLWPDGTPYDEREVRTIREARLPYAPSSEPTWNTATDTSQPSASV